MLSSSIGLALWMWANYLQNDFCYEQFYIIYTTEILNWPIVPEHMLFSVAFQGILFYNICLISISVIQAKQALHVDGAPTLDSHCNNLFLRLKDSPRLSQPWRYRHFFTYHAYLTPYASAILDFIILSQAWENNVNRWTIWSKCNRI